MSREKHISKEYPVVVPSPGYNPPFVHLKFNTWMALAAIYTSIHDTFKTPEVVGNILLFLNKDDIRKFTLSARLFLGLRILSVLYFHPEQALELYPRSFPLQKKSFWSGCFSDNTRDSTARTQKNTSIISHHPINASKFSPDGKWIVTERFWHDISIWSVESGQCIKTIKDKVCNLISVAINDLGQLVVLYRYHYKDLDKTNYKLLNAITGKCIRQFEFDGNACEGVNFKGMSSDGKYLLSIQNNYSTGKANIKLWDVATKDFIKEWIIADGVSDAFCTRDFTRIYLTSCFRHFLTVLNVTSNDIHRIDCKDDYFDHVCADEKYALLRNNNDSRVKIYSIECNECIHSFDISAGRGQRVKAFFVDSADKLAIVNKSYNEQYKLNLFSMKTGKLFVQKSIGWDKPEFFAVHNDEFLLGFQKHNNDYEIQLFSATHRLMREDYLEDSTPIFTPRLT